MKQKGLGLLAVSAMLALTLSACGGKNNDEGSSASASNKPSSSASSSPSDASPSAPPAENVVLKVTGYKSGTELGAIPELNEKFMKENPNIKVEYEGMPGAQFKDFIKTRFAAGDASDVIMLHPGLSELLQYGQAGYLMDISGEPFLSNFTQAALKATTQDGKVYGIPNDMAVLGVYYNKEIFNKLGLSVPTNWDDFVADADKIKQSGTLPIAIGNNDGWMTLAALFTLAPSAVYDGHPDFDKQLNEGKATFAGTWDDMVNKWFSLNDKGYLTPKSTGVSLDQAQKAFAKGDAAMYIDGNWSLPGIKSANPNIQVGMFAMPANAAGKDVVASAAVGTTFAINKDTKVADAAKKYLAFWSQAENQKVWAKSQQSFMTINGETGDIDEAFKEIAAVVASGHSYQFLDQGWTYGGAATTEMMTSAQGVYLKAIKPAEMLTNMDKAWADAAKKK
ncbi:ABC transporter substrate-binding protein [Cohnella soli]|uniref:ABC transporter substrate-binding protein n=1 Tax=Cohnella soli TaxID=425005 RepID=A0ABW0HSH4_9BACL